MKCSFLAPVAALRKLGHVRLNSQEVEALLRCGLVLVLPYFFLVLDLFTYSGLKFFTDQLKISLRHTIY